MINNPCRDCILLPVCKDSFSRNYEQWIKLSKKTTHASRGLWFNYKLKYILKDCYNLRIENEECGWVVNINSKLEILNVSRL